MALAELANPKEIFSPNGKTESFHTKLARISTRIRQWEIDRSALSLSSEDELWFALTEFMEFVLTLDVRELSIKQAVELGDTLFLTLSSICKRFTEIHPYVVIEDLTKQALHSLNGQGAGDRGIYFLEKVLQDLYAASAGRPEEFLRTAKVALTTLISVYQYHVHSRDPQSHSSVGVALTEALEQVLQKNEFNRPVGLFGHPVFQFLEDAERTDELHFLANRLENMARTYRKKVAPTDRELNRIQSAFLVKTCLPLFDTLLKKLREDNERFTEKLFSSDLSVATLEARALAELGILEESRVTTG